MSLVHNSTIITTASQTIDVAETITYIYEQVAEAMQEWRMIELTQVKWINKQHAFNPIERYETRAILINPDNIVTVWPATDFEEQK
jgi:hypothetical protein